MTTPARYRPSLLDLVERDGAQRVARILPVPAPAVGAEWSIVVPGGVVWRLQVLQARLITSAVVANRSARLQLGDGSATILVSAASTVVTASGSALNTWGRGITGFNNGLSGGTLPQSLPDLLLVGGLTLSTSTANLDVADAWSQIVLYLIELRPPLDVDLAGTILPASPPEPEV